MYTPCPSAAPLLKPVSLPAGWHHMVDEGFYVDPPHEVKAIVALVAVALKAAGREVDEGMCFMGWQRWYAQLMIDTWNTPQAK